MKLKKRIISMLLAVMLICVSVPTAFAASEEAVAAANALYSLGLFSGTGTDANGNPEFDLDRAPTRNEAVTMLVRLLGKEGEAKSGTWDIPFTDVAEWAKPYVGYAYANKLTGGTSATTFGGSDQVSATQYLTFVLRALGYKSSVDFQWDKAWELSDQLGITHGQYNAASSFSRGDTAIVSYSALTQRAKDLNITLIQSLQSCGAVTQGAELTSLLSGSAGILYYAEFDGLPKVENVNIRKRASGATSKNENALYWIYRYEFDNEREASETLSSYLSFLRGLGYLVVDASNAYMNMYKVTIPTTGKTVEVDYSEFVSGKTWVINVEIDRNDVTITDQTIVPNVKLSRATHSMVIGESFELQATVDAGGRAVKVYWETADPNLVSISAANTRTANGVLYSTVTVKALKAGVATITATTSDNVADSAFFGIYNTADEKESELVGYAQAAVDLLRSELKAPQSLILNRVRIYESSETEVVEIDYSAMNGFGGYNRAYYYYSGLGNRQDYSIIDRYGYEYTEIDTSKLK